MSENAIRERLASYLAGEIALDDLEDWIAQRTWNLHKFGNERCQKLAYAIESKLSEHSSGHLTDEGLRRELRPFVTSYTTWISWGDVFPISLGASNVTQQVLAPQLALAGRSLEVVFA